MQYMNIMSYLYVIIILCIYTISVKSSFCYWNTGCPYKYFSGKTPYNAVRGDIRDSIVKLKGCEPIQIWGLMRHGKRHPGADYGSKMKEAIVFRDYIASSYAKGKSSLCAQDVENLHDWSIDDKMFDKVHDLANEGHQEMVGIGKRLKQAFPKLLNNLEKGSYTFRPANGHWMTDSAKGLIHGLGNDHLIIENAILDNDVMAPYATCGKYQRDVKKNPETYLEATKYLNTSDYLAAKDRIQRRTGIEYILTDDHITSLYDLCRYTSSGIDNKISPWCALFTTDDLKVLEYIGDLRHYYRNGYGTPMNEIFGQIPLADLLKNFQESKEGKGKKIISYITHATALDMTYTALGIYKDESPLTAAHRNKDRKWRSSKNTAFAANLIAVLNRCDKDGTDDYNVVFYLNEEPLRSICKDGVCSWQEFEDKLKPFINTSIDFCEFKTEPL